MTPKTHAIVWKANDIAQTFNVIADTHGAYVLGAGEFLIKTYTGLIFIAAFTGRTRQFFGLACPTAVRYDIDTIATADGVILGVKGQKIAGTVAIRPDYVTA